MVNFVSEAETQRLISHEAAFEPVQQALIAAASGQAQVFPAVIATASEPQNTFSMKSGSTADLAGLKVGSFWPGNPPKGLPRPNSTILLIDQGTGRIGAVIEASAVNAFRTAAADAVAAKALANPGSETLAIFGAGHQALYECAALARILPLQRILVVARDPDKVGSFAERLAAQGVKADVRAVPAREACGEADVIVTATPSRAPLFEAAWVRPGTHVAAMGADARGKQELPPELFRRARLFCDLPSQSVEIGEFQHVRDEIERGEIVLSALGDVLEMRARPAAWRPPTSPSSTVPGSRSKIFTSVGSSWPHRGRRTSPRRRRTLHDPAPPSLRTLGGDGPVRVRIPPSKRLIGSRPIANRAPPVQAATAPGALTSRWVHVQRPFAGRLCKRLLRWAGRRRIEVGAEVTGWRSSGRT